MALQFIAPIKVNLIPKPDAAIANCPTKGAVVDAVGIFGFTYGVRFPSNAAGPYCYQSAPLKVGVDYTVSVFVKLDDGSVPIVSTLSNAGDFGLVLGGDLVTSAATVADMGGGVYRVSATLQTTSVTKSNCGVVKYSTQSIKPFVVSGWMVNEGKSVQPFSTTLIKTQPSLFANLVPLFTDATWTRHANAQASLDGLTLTLSAVAATQQSFCTISVTPRTSYSLGVAATASAGSIEVYINWLRADMSLLGKQLAMLSTSGTITGVSPPDAYKADLRVRNGALAGTFTFSDLTLRRVQPDNGELVVNGDFSQGATGWAVHANASVTGGQLVLNAISTANHFTAQSCAVSPNTTYTVRATASANSKVTIGWSSSGFQNFFPVNGVVDGTFTVPSGNTSINLNLGNGGGAGTYTFDNISLKRTTPEPYFKELVVNGDFSQGATGWFTNPGTGSFVVSNEESILSSANTGGTGTIGMSVNTPNTPVSGNTSYTLKANVRHISGTSNGGTNFRIHWLGANGDHVLYTSGYPATPGSNANVTLTDISPSGARTAIVEMIARGDQVLAFDNISLKRAMPPPPM